MSTCIVIPQPQICMPLHNQHVVAFFRWRAWLAKHRRRHLSSFFWADFARHEQEAQAAVVE